MSDRRVRSDALAVLGLTPAATPEQVTTAYRRLARQAHPDLCADADAAARFAVIDAAYRAVRGGAAGPPTAEPTRLRVTRVGPRPRMPRGATLVAGPVRVVTSPGPGPASPAQGRRGSA